MNPNASQLMGARRAGDDAGALSRAISECLNLKPQGPATGASVGTGGDPRGSAEASWRK